MAVQTATRALDPVTIEVIRNAFPAISDEMSYDLQRTSYNMMIYEVRDYCTAVLDADAKLMCQNVGGVSHFVADLGAVIRDGLDRYGRDGFKPGDVIVHNHQAIAGQHLNNVVVYTPFFWEGELIGFPTVRAHWADIGGSGGGSVVFDPWSEGLQLDQLKLYHAGVLDRQLNKVIADNIRFPEAAMGDLRSQMAACRLAERRLADMFRRYGKDTVLGSIEAIYADTEERCRKEIEKIPDGVYESETMMPGNATDPEPLRVHAKVTVRGSDMTIDLSGCSQQRRSAINSRTYAGAYIVYKALTLPLEPVNEGSFAALRTVIPEGNIMMAKFPAPMSGWSGLLPTVVDTVLHALAPAIPDRVGAGHHAVLSPIMGISGRDPKTGTPYNVRTIEGGGWGGRPDGDGEAMVTVCQGDVHNAPIESMELKGPVFIEERSFRNDTGGPGKFRGSPGTDIRMRYLVPFRTAWGSFAGGARAPWGLSGGKSGAPPGYPMRMKGETELTVHKVNTPQWLEPPFTLSYQAAGGGGWGDPLDRDTWRVLEDVLDEYVSVGSARQDYGVVITADGKAVDEEATRKLRGGWRRRS